MNCSQFDTEQRRRTNAYVAAPENIRKKKEIQLENLNTLNAKLIACTDDGIAFLLKERSSFQRGRSNG